MQRRGRQRRGRQGMGGGLYGHQVGWLGEGRLVGRLRDRGYG